jgi:hypothetical protein
MASSSSQQASLNLDYGKKLTFKGTTMDTLTKDDLSLVIEDLVDFKSLRVNNVDIKPVYSHLVKEFLTRSEVSDEDDTKNELRQRQASDEIEEVYGNALLAAVLVHMRLKKKSDIVYPNTVFKIRNEKRNYFGDYTFISKEDPTEVILEYIKLTQRNHWSGTVSE